MPNLVKTKNVFTDGEGPLVFKDIARDIASQKIPRGRIFFDTLSLYVANASETGNSYQPGETLAFLVPHLLAHSITDEDIHLEASNTRIANGADVYLRLLKSEGVSIRVISSAYDHLWAKVGPIFGIPQEHIASTRLNLQLLKETAWHQRLSSLVLEAEARILTKEYELLRAHEDIRNGMAITEAFHRHRALSDAHNSLVNLYHVVLPSLGFNPLEETRVVGGQRKVDSVINFAQDLGLQPDEIVYVGDSITDDRTHKFVKENGGLSIAVNGDEFAIRNAVVAVATESMTELKPLLDAWYRGGIEYVKRFVDQSQVVFFGKERPITSEGSTTFYHLVEDGNITQIAEKHRDYKNRIRGNSTSII